jgi:N-acetylglutamate synthase-like GNAT family acetyltransferase
LDIKIRRAKESDKPAVFEVEAQATKNLQYLPEVWDEFAADEIGEFGVAEMDGEVVGVGKFTVVADGSAWLEALRVLPSKQGTGVGKRFYERFFEIAEKRGITTMRMYTGVKNAASKGLAERYGFHLAGTFRGAWLAGTTPKPVSGFARITDPARASDLIMPLRAGWGGFTVMNRTFFEITPALCAYHAKRGEVYAHEDGKTVAVLGARFMPKQALHLAIFGGDTGRCLDLAEAKLAESGAGRISCLYQPTAAGVEETLVARGYRIEASDFIVMEVNIKR